MKIDSARARKRFRQGPVGTWASYLGGGHDGLMGMRLTFLRNGTGTMKEWGFDEIYDPSYVTEPKFRWKNVGDRVIEITHRDHVRSIAYEFKDTINEYGAVELRMFEPALKPDKRGEVGFSVCPYSLVYQSQPRGFIAQLREMLRRVGE